MGLAAGAVYGLIQFLIEPVVVHWAQVVLDYPLPFVNSFSAWSWCFCSIGARAGVSSQTSGEARRAVMARGCSFGPCKEGCDRWRPTMEIDQLTKDTGR